jgi:O-antigen ligase
MTGIFVKYGAHISKRMAGATESLAGEKRQSRANLARDALRIINDNKLKGVGLEQYRYHADPSIPGLRIVHNAYLLIGAEQGIPSLFIFFAIQGIVFYAGIKVLKSRDRFLFNVGTATLTSFIAVSIYHLIAPDYRMVGVLLQHWRISGMLLGLLICNDLHEKKIARWALSRTLENPAPRIDRPMK